MNRFLLLLVCAFAAHAAPVAAQQGLPNCTETSRSSRQITADHLVFSGSVQAPVEIECPDMKIFAEEVEFFTAEHRLVGTGNVVYTSATSQIGADRAEYDTHTRTGTFFNASGMALIQAKADRSMFGTQEPEAYFYGEKVEKIGPRTYRITHGGFTTCLQPTPRWEFAATTVTLTLDEHAVLWNAVFRVKNVPLFYLPALYYPIEKNARSTGFLLPTYGASTFKGQTLRNAFFWAINRSQDATLYWDYYSKTGNAFGTEYRYVAAPGSLGSAYVNVLREHEAEVLQSGQTEPTVLPARRSYEIRANVTQALPDRLRAQANVDYFSTLTVLPAYYTNIYDASQRTRSYGGILSGSWGVYNVSGAYQVNEYFYGENSSTKYGGTPRLSFSQSQREIGRLPLFFAVAADYEHRVYQSQAADVVTDRGLSKADTTSSLRAPFNKISFLTWDSTLSWPVTYYTQSLDASGAQVATPVVRTYLDMRSEVTGPVFVRVWNTPTNGYAEKFKHVIEPAVEFRYLTNIANAGDIVKTGDASDYIIGGNGQIRYRLTNRVLARRKAASGPSASREILTVSIQQTYYSDKAASQVDPGYSSSFRGRTVSNFSPIALSANSSLTERLTATMGLEYDPDLKAVQSFGLRGGGGVGWVRANAGWSRRRIVTTLDNNLTADANVRSPANRVGGLYNLNYDIYRGLLVQQRIMGYYNAQCCGITIEYQTFNYGTIDPRYGVPSDHRFNISFTLAGVGTFANPFGAMSGAGRQ